MSKTIECPKCGCSCMVLVYKHKNVPEYIREKKVVMCRKCNFMFSSLQEVDNVSQQGRY